jgi:Tfp pilus assembly protein PilV
VDNGSISIELTIAAAQARFIKGKGFTLIEFVVAFAILMLVLAGILNLVCADLLSFRLSRQQSLLKNIAESELNRLKTLDFADPDLDTSSTHSLNLTTPRGQKVTIAWTVVEEESTSERIKVKRIDLVPYTAQHPIKSKIFQARIFYYAYQQPQS